MEKGERKMTTTHTFSKNEEIANAITHGIGIALSIAALVLLIIQGVQQGTAWHVVSFTLFGATMVLLYVNSTLLHSMPQGKVKDFFEVMDHASIYLFIAGTYTPFLFIGLKGALGWTLFGIIWGIAVVGVLFKVFFVKRFLFMSTVFYVLMGWLIVFAWKPLTTALPSGALTFLMIGGIVYTIGSVFYVWRGFRYHHAVWHLFVIGGSVFHFFAVFLYI